MANTTFVQVSDLTGDIDVTQNSYAQDNALDIIKKTEKQYLRQLLGDDLYLAFIADLSSYVPQTQKYTDLLDGKNYKVVNTDDVIVNKIFRGVKEMLKYFCYYDIVINSRYYNSLMGEYKAEAENSERLTASEMNDLLMDAWNKAVDIYNEAFDYLTEINAPVEVIGVIGTTVSTGRTKLLVATDKVELDGTEYTVGIVTENVSFTVTVAPGDIGLWEKEFYANWKFKKEKKMYFDGVL